MNKKELVKISPFLALIIFILFRWFFVYIEWMGRNVPPVPADAYTYLIEVKKIILSGKIISHFPGSQPANSTRSITFNLLIFLIHKITKLSLEKSFHLNFYLSTVILAFSLFLFLKNFFNNKKDKKNYLVVGLLSLALFSGEGGYHGFYWLVPSFYSLLFFILIISQVFNSKKYSWILIFLFSLLFIFSHQISFYISFIFLLFLGFCILFELLLTKISFKKIINRDRKIIKKIIFAFFSCLVIFVISRTLFKLNYIKLGTTHGDVKRIVGMVMPVPSPNYTIFNKIWLTLSQILFSLIKYYFKYIFLNPILFLVWALSLYFCFKEKQYRLLSLYFASLVFFIMSNLHPWGNRSLLFLWPYTFLLFGVGIYEAFKNARNNKLKLALSLLIGCYLIWALYFALFQPRCLHAAWNISWDKKCADELLKLTDKNETILYSDRMGSAAFSTYGLVQRKAILIDKEKKYNPNIEQFSFIVLKTISNPQIELPYLKLSKIKECGFYTIYKVKDRENEN